MNVDFKIQHFHIGIGTKAILALMYSESDGTIMQAYGSVISPYTAVHVCRHVDCECLFVPPTPT